MLANRLEHQLPIEAVKETLNVEIEHPVVAPAALTSRAHGIDRRLAGSVAVRVRIEYRLKHWLQVSADDFLCDAVRHRRNAQRAHATARFWNIDPPYRRRKVAP